MAQCKVYIYITVKHSSHITVEINHPKLWTKIAEIMSLYETGWILSRSFFSHWHQIHCLLRTWHVWVYYHRLRLGQSILYQIKSSWVGLKETTVHSRYIPQHSTFFYLHSTQWNAGAVALTKMNLTQLMSQTRLMEIFGLTRDIHQHSTLLLPQH